MTTTFPQAVACRSLPLGYASPAKRRRFGQTGAPIKATHVFRRETRDPDHSAITVERWVLVNEVNQTVTRATTLNGQTGERFDARQCQRWLNWDDVRYSIEGYDAVDIAQCPIAAIEQSANGLCGLATDRTSSQSN